MNLDVEVVFPAQAGVIPAKELSGMAAGGIPRASGGDPHRKQLYGYSNIVFPAQAGVIPSDLRNSIVVLGIPRASGGDPLVQKIPSGF